MKTITAAEALMALAEGKSIMSSWDKDPVKLSKGVLRYPDGREAGLNGLLTGKNLRIFEEPKKQIKLALYAYFNGTRWISTNWLYKDDIDFREAIDKSIFKRLDGTNGTIDTTMLVDEY